MNKQMVFGRLTRTRGEIIEQRQDNGLWKSIDNLPAHEQTIIRETVKEIKNVEMWKAHPSLYGDVGRHLK